MSKEERAAPLWKSSLSPRSLLFQLLSRSLIILAVLFLLIGLTQYLILKDLYYESVARSMSGEMMGFPKNISFGSNPQPGPGTGPGGAGSGSTPSPSDAAGIPKPPLPGLFFLHDASLAYINEEGEYTDVTAESGTISPQLSASEYEAIRSRLKHRPNQYEQTVAEDAEGNEQMLVFRLSGNGPGDEGTLLQMGRYTKAIESSLNRQLLLFIGLALAALIGGFILYWTVLRGTLKPLMRMAETVEKTDAASLDARLPLNNKQLEIDRLSASFNGLLERLEAAFEVERESMEQMRRFIADASHELRTPLTSIHGFLEVLLRGAADNPQQLKTALNSMYGESNRILKLVEDLLLLAKLDRAPQLCLERLNISDLLAEMEPQLRVLAERRQVNFTLPDGIAAYCDKDKIKQVILNLYSNAVQHTHPSEGRISVALSSMPAGIQLTVADNGVGLSEEQQAHIFDRFYRTDTSRTRSQGGAGLGLAIVKSLVEAHGGTIAVRSRPGEGAVFIVSLPHQTSDFLLKAPIPESPDGD